APGVRRAPRVDHLAAARRARPAGPAGLSERRRFRLGRGGLHDEQPLGLRRRDRPLLPPALSLRERPPPLPVPRTAASADDGPVRGPPRAPLPPEERRRRP